MEKETLLEQAKKINTPSKRHITDEEYEVLIAYAKEEISGKHAAQVLGISKTNYGNLYSKTLSAFKRYIKENEKK